MQEDPIHKYAVEYYGWPEEVPLEGDQREAFKQINFGLLYGTGPKRLRELLCQQKEDTDV